MDDTKAVTIAIGRLPNQPHDAKTYTHTEMRFILCMWFGEFCSCCSLTSLPGPAWVLLNWICKELISSL